MSLLKLRCTSGRRLRPRMSALLNRSTTIITSIHHCLASINVSPSSGTGTPPPLAPALFHPRFWLILHPAALLPPSRSSSPQKLTLLLASHDVHAVKLYESRVSQSYSYRSGTTRTVSGCWLHLRAYYSHSFNAKFFKQLPVLKHPRKLWCS